MALPVVNGQNLDPFQAMVAVLEQQNKKTEEARSKEQQAFVAYKNTAEETQAALLRRITALEAEKLLATAHQQVLNRENGYLKQKLTLIEQMVPFHRAVQADLLYLSKEIKSLEEFLIPLQQPPKLFYDCGCGYGCSPPIESHDTPMSPEAISSHYQRVCKSPRPLTGEYQMDVQKYRIQQAYEKLKKEYLCPQ